MCVQEGGSRAGRPADRPQTAHAPQDVGQLVGGAEREGGAVHALQRALVGGVNAHHRAAHQRHLPRAGAGAGRDKARCKVLPTHIWVVQWAGPRATGRQAALRCSRAAWRSRRTQGEGSPGEQGG